MNPNSIIEMIVCWQFVIFALCTSILTSLIRVGIEDLIPKLENEKWFQDIILPILPLFLSCCIILCCKSVALPNNIGDTFSGRIIYGLICGQFSGTIFRLVKNTLESLVPRSKDETKNG